MQYYWSIIEVWLQYNHYWRSILVVYLKYTSRLSFLVRVIKLKIYCLSFVISAPPTTPYWKIYCHPRIIKHLITCTFTLIFIDNTGTTGLCYWLLSITLACILTLPNIHVPCTPCLAKKTQGSALYHNLCCV